MRSRIFLRIVFATATILLISNSSGSTAENELRKYCLSLVDSLSEPVVANAVEQWAETHAFGKVFRVSDVKRTRWYPGFFEIDVAFDWKLLGRNPDQYKVQLLDVSIAGQNADSCRYPSPLQSAFISYVTEDSPAEVEIQFGGIFIGERSRVGLLYRKEASNRLCFESDYESIEWIDDKLGVLCVLDDPRL